MSRGLVYARLVRLPNVFTAAADVSVGLLIGAGHFGILTGICLVIASTCLYVAGMIWNDYFDRHIDLIERPTRPIPSGDVTARFALRVANFFAGIALLAALCAGGTTSGWSPWPIAHSMVLLALILAYDRGLKKTVAGPFVMGACRAVNMLLGFAALDSDIASWPMRIAFALVNGAYVVGITLFARDEAGKSRPRRLRFALAVILAALAGGCLAASLSADPWSGGIYLLAALAVRLSWQAAPAIAKPTPANVQAFVKSAILGIVILDAALASCAAGPLGLAIIGWLVPALWLGRRIYST